MGIPRPELVVALVATRLDKLSEAFYVEASHGGWPILVRLAPDGDLSTTFTLGVFDFDPVLGSTPDLQAEAIAQNVVHLVEEWRSTVGNATWREMMKGRIDWRSPWNDWRVES